MAANQLFCKFHQYGHCKFGAKCKKFHTKETCSNLKCKVDRCISRHPRQCKFYLLFGRCKFGDSCSFLHITAEENVVKALKEEILTLKTEMKSLMEKNCEIEARLENLERENKSVNKDDIENLKSMEKHKCDECGYEANTLTVLKRHKTMKHKQTTSTSSSTLSKPSSISPNAAYNPTIPCAMEDEGCKNFVSQYFNKYTAICLPCKQNLENMMKSSPFPSTACPCCHDPSNGLPFSFCKECLSGLDQDGYMESGWGSWHLDENSGEIICTHLDFQIL